MEYCPICERPMHIAYGYSYFDICKGHPEPNFQITINGQSQEIILLREISSKLDQLIDLLGKK